MINTDYSYIQVVNRDKDNHVQETQTERCYINMSNESLQGGLSIHNGSIFNFSLVLQGSQNNGILSDGHDNWDEQSNIPNLNITESS